jgi:hypothetical protein
MVAWGCVSAKTRIVFGAALAVDVAALARGRGWALSFGPIALPSFKRASPTLDCIAHHAIAEGFCDHEHIGEHAP